MCHASALLGPAPHTAHHALVDDAAISQDAVDGRPAGWAAFQVLKAPGLRPERHCLPCTARLGVVWWQRLASWVGCLQQQPR